MASDVEASCENDPNFAVICAFLEKFGNQCGLPSVDFLELQAMLENYDEVPPCLTSLFLKLLRRVKKSVKTDKWEKSLIAVCHNFSSLDAWEIERFGYKKAKLSSKVRVLKELLEMQFDHHVKFKNEINKLAASELRSQPLGRDKAGHAYWFQNDDNYQIRVYKEDLDEETWTLIAKDRESLVSLITKLNDGDSKSSSDSAVNEDSNSSDKPIIDTGQNDSDTKKDILEKPDDSVETQRPFNVNEENSKEQEKNAIPHGDMNEKVKPMLRIKSLSELLDTTAKRSRFSDDDEEEDPQHPIKIRLKKFPKEPIVGEEIVEPVMKVEGEGSGKENNSTCAIFLNELHGNFDLVENFIVGEPIEEDVLYFQGEGSGAECLTGNNELASTSKTQSTNILNIQNNCENSPDSINNSLCKVNDNKEIKEAPSCKLGTTSDDKTDNNISNFFLSPAETKPVEENCIGKDDSADNNTESRTPPQTLKKNMFFFGSTALKNTSLSPVSMGFGQTAPRNDTCGIEMNSEFQLEKTENNVKEKEIFETKEHAMENNIGNDVDVKSPAKSVINDVIKNNCGKEDDNINDANLVQSQTYQEKSVSQSDDVDSNKGCISDEAVPVIEELCIKKIAYVCGEENEEENDESSELTNTNLTVSDASKKETKKNETPIVQIVNLEINLKKSINEPEISEENDSTVEKPISIDDEKVNNLETSKSETKISDIVNESNIDEEASEKPNNHNDFKLTVVQKSQTSLRSVRSKKVANASGKQAEEPGTTPIQAKENVRSEVVLIKGRKAKTRKEQEVTVPPASLPTTKKPKLAKVKNRKEKIVLSTRTMRPRLEIKDVLEIKAKPEKCIESANSSRVSTPVSITESVITLTESVDSNSVDVVDKDPLADTDEESTGLPKPVNIQSISFDFNDSSTPPPIPVIPTKRTLRKRGRDASPEVQLVEVKPEKRMKMKGKRQVNMKLRKSIEQQKEQQVSSSDEIVEVSGEDGRKKSAKTLPKKKPRQPPKSKKFIEVSDDSSNPSTPIPVKTQKNKNKRILAGLDIYDDQPVDSRVRQSRRLAQIKIKEHLEPKKPEYKAKEGKIQKKRGKEKEVKTPEKLKKDKKENTPEREKEPEEIKKRKKRSKAPNKIFDEHKPWKSSSESSEAEEEVEEEEEVIEEYYEPPLEFKSDHEFSPESDVASEGEYQPPKRARTARKKTSEEPEAEEFFPCQKCGKSDHPEWVLLCDKCDNGWHCSCLRPPLLGIPEGDWFCPTCQHLQLVDNLNSKLREYDKKLTKKSLEDRRKERLAYVGISLNNVLPTREQEHRKTKRRHSAEATESSSEESASSTAESESDDEPIYQLRQRRQARSYKFNEYDDLINSAIQDEMNEKQDTVSAVQSRGKDMSTIVNAEEEGRKPKDTEQIKKDDAGKVLEGNLLPERKVPSQEEKVDNSDDEPIKPLVKTIKKKSRKICNLDVSSEEDDEKDEDFKGSSSGSEEEDDEELEEDSEEESDDYVRGGKRRKNLHPVRRSTRARVCKYGADYVNDSDYEDAPKKKKTTRYWSESDSTESDGSWGKKKRRGRSGLIKRRKKKKKSILDELSDVEVFKKKKKPKIKYGLTSSEEEMGRGRRTRGKKMTYIDTLGSDSDEETRKRTASRIDSDDENDEDFVANDEEEKDSEEVPEEDDDENKKDDEQESSSERRPLIVPKIYIKKPPFTKEIEKINERRISKGDINSKEPNKSETAPSSFNSKESQLVVKDVNIEAKSETEKQKLEMVQKKDELKAEMKPDKNDEISKPSDDKTELVNVLNDKPKSNDEKPKVAEKVEIENDQTKQISERLKCVEMKEKTDRFDLVEKQLASLHESQSSNEYKVGNLQTYENELNEQLGEDDFDLEENPIEQINKNLEEMDSDEMEKMMEEEYANKQLQLVALQIEKEKKRKERSEARQLEMASKLAEKPQPAKRGRKPKLKPPVPPNASVHEPIVSNVRALIRNDDNNDELSEPPGVTLPLFDELAIRKSAEDMTKKRKGRGKGKKSLEEAVANLGGKRKETTATSLNVCNIEIASNPQPFAQASPTPSVITRMLQSKPGQVATYPIGTIRPKQFATMPADDDDSPGGSRDSLPATGHLPGPIPGQFMPGEPRGIPYRQLPLNVNQYARGMLPPRQMRAPPSAGMVPHLYQPHRLLDPSPSGGGPINMVDTNQSVPTPCSSPKNESQNYSRPPVNRFPPISTATSIAGTPPRPAHIMTHMQQPRHSNLNPYPQPSFYGGYPTDSGSNEDAMPPSVYQGPQYSEQYASEAGADPSENSNSKSFGGDESGGEFGGLVSYFSSQREDDLES